MLQGITWCYASSEKAPTPTSSTSRGLSGGVRHGLVSLKRWTEISRQISRRQGGNKWPSQAEETASARARDNSHYGVYTGTTSTESRVRLGLDHKGPQTWVKELWLYLNMIGVTEGVYTRVGHWDLGLRTMSLAAEWMMGCRLVGESRSYGLGRRLLQSLQAGCWDWTSVTSPPTAENYLDGSPCPHELRPFSVI